MKKSKSVEFEADKKCSKMNKKRTLKAHGKFKTITPQLKCCEDIIEHDQRDSNGREST